MVENWLLRCVRNAGSSRRTLDQPILSFSLGKKGHDMTSEQTPTTSAQTPEPPEDPVRPHRWTLATAITAIIISLISAAISGVSAYVNLDWAKQTRKRDEQIKKLDIADHLIDRFYQIELINEQLKREKKKDPEQLSSYYNRLYGLHWEEFTFYKGGLVDRDIYLTWLRYRNRMVQRDRDNERARWKEVRQYHIVEPCFVKLMDAVVGADDDSHIEEYLDAALKCGSESAG
jgi:hypothetical protein